MAPQDSPDHMLISLSTGTWVVRPHGARGRNVLKIQNGTDLDAAVELVTASVPRKTFWIVYKRAREEKVVGGIAAGTYLLRFALGQDWEATTRKS